MPLPFLVAGIGLLAGAIGAGGHLNAKDTNKKAEEKAEEAEKIYQNAKNKLSYSKAKAEKKLIQLGYSKKNILETSMTQFLESYDKIKKIKLEISPGMNEISNFIINEESAIEMKKMTSVYSSSLSSTAAGAATGAAIALATSGSLSLVTGTLGAAGTALLAGEVGAAAGLTGTALSFGAAMTPFAAIAAPVVLFTGISASIKADENLEKAETMYSEAVLAVEKIKTKIYLCEAIEEKADLFNELLINLNIMFAECSSLMAGMIKKREGWLFKKKLTSKSFNENDLKLIATTRALAGAIKSIIDTPMLNNSGEISTEAINMYNDTSKKMISFKNAVTNTKAVNQNIKPIKLKIKSKEDKKDYSNLKNITNTFLLWIRRILSIVFGIGIGAFLGLTFSNYFGFNYFLLDFLHYKTIFFINLILMFILACSTIMILFGNFYDTIIEKICYSSSKLSIFLLYITYFGNVYKLQKDIIFSIIFFLVNIGIIGVIESKFNKKQFSYYLKNIFEISACYPIAYMVYLLFANFFNLSIKISFVISLFIVFCMYKEKK